MYPQPAGRRNRVSRTQSLAVAGPRGPGDDGRPGHSTRRVSQESAPAAATRRRRRHRRTHLDEDADLIGRLREHDCAHLRVLGRRVPARAPVLGGPLQPDRPQGTDEQKHAGQCAGDPRCGHHSHGDTGHDRKHLHQLQYERVVVDRVRAALGPARSVRAVGRDVFGRTTAQQKPDTHRDDHPLPAYHPCGPTSSPASSGRRTAHRAADSMSLTNTVNKKAIPDTGIRYRRNSAHTRTVSTRSPSLDVIPGGDDWTSSRTRMTI